MVDILVSTPTFLLRSNDNDRLVSHTFSLQHDVALYVLLKVFHVIFVHQFAVILFFYFFFYRVHFICNKGITVEMLT